jgi:hypothetical protein
MDKVVLGEEWPLVIVAAHFGLDSKSTAYALRERRHEAVTILDISSQEGISGRNLILGVRLSERRCHKKAHDQ